VESKRSGNHVHTKKARDKKNLCFLGLCWQFNI